MHLHIYAGEATRGEDCVRGCTGRKNRGKDRTFCPFRVPPAPVDKNVYVDKIVHLDKVKYVDVPVYKDKIVYLDKFIEVEVEKVVEKIKEVPVYIDVPVVTNTIVEKVTEVVMCSVMLSTMLPQCHRLRLFACSYLKISIAGP